MAKDNDAESLLIEQLRLAFSYDPHTGFLIRNPRPDWSASCNTRWAGKPAGSRGAGGEGYSYVSLDGKFYRAHRVVWAIYYGAFPQCDIDHINGDRLDNRIANLRLATRSENMRNRGPNRSNKTGLKGVSWCAFTGRWRATIVHNGKQKNLGRFDTPEMAHAEYARAAIRLHGRFSKS